MTLTLCTSVCHDMVLAVVKMSNVNLYSAFTSKPLMRCVCVCVWCRNTGRVRWNYVVSNLIQVLASLFYMYYIFERFCIPMFRDFTSDYVTPRRIIVSIFGCILPGTLVLFIGEAYTVCLRVWVYSMWYVCCQIILVSIGTTNVGTWRDQYLPTFE